MNSVFLILLLLCCCNHGSEGTCGGSVSECGSAHTGNCAEGKDCKKHSHDHERGCGCPGENARRDDNPFSPFDRGGECKEEKYPEFRGNKGPCGCEDQSES